MGQTEKASAIIQDWNFVRTDEKTLWEKVLNKINKYEQALKLKSELKEAFDQIAILKNSKGHKQTLNEFLYEL